MEKFDKVSKIWKGTSVRYPFPMDFMFGDLILKKLNEIDPKKILQICADDDTALTCEEFKYSIIRVAQNLIKIGVKTDDVIGLVTHQSHMTTIIINGSILIGAPLNPVHQSLDENDIRAVFSKTKPKIIICDEEAIPKFKNALKDVEFKYEIYSTCEDSEYPKASDLLKPTNEEENFEPFNFKKPSDEKPLAIICTSGTSGSPKGCTLSHAFLNSFASLTAIFEMVERTIGRNLCFSSLNWITGFFQNVFLPFSKNLRILTRKGFTVESTIEIVEKYEITNITFAPFDLAALLNSKEFLSSKNQSLQTFMAAGSIVSSSLRKKFESIFPERKLMISYGLTETTVSITNLGDYKTDGSVGSIIFPNTLVKIVDDDGNPLDCGKTGEICAKPFFKFLGYYNDPEAFRKALDKDGFFKTGDLGYFTENGHLCVVDRKKDILKYKGFQFNPSEIENTIQSIDGVEMVSVVGLPDINVINSSAAAIVKSKDSNLTSEEVINFVAAKLPFYKQLHGGVYFFENLPMTSSGKIIKRLVEENIFKFL